MSLFDQQPMGPVPARRPILNPPDPELEAEVPDPANTEVELVGPVPEELASPVPPVPKASPARRWSTIALAALLLVLLAGGIPEGIVVLVRAALAGGTPEGVALVILASMVIGAALVWWRRRNLRRVGPCADLRTPAGRSRRR